MQTQANLPLAGSRIVTISSPNGQPPVKNTIDPMAWVEANLKRVACPIAPFSAYLLSPGASRFLLENFNHPKNRRKKDFSIKKMAADMEGGLWRVTHQGIAFDEDWWLFDGQNRLYAIIEAGVSVPMLVFFNVAREAHPACDIGRPRSIVDGAKYRGTNVSNNSQVAIARRMMQRMHARVCLSNQTIEQYVIDHQDAIDFTIQAFAGKRKSLTIAPVMAVVSRAYYTHNRSRLDSFCRHVKTGEPDSAETDQAALALRDYLMLHGRYGGTANDNAYRKTQQALSAYLVGSKIKKLTGSNKEQFVVPGDEEVDRLLGYEEECVD